MMNDEISFRLPPPAASIPAPPPEPAPTMVPLTIDGRAVEVAAGATLIDACKTLDITIPTLCYLDTLTPVNACRVCVVEVAGARVLVPACSRRVEPGMVVTTRSPRVDLSRKVVLELLGSSVDLSTAPGLAEMIVEYGARPERFQEVIGSAFAVSSVAQPVRIDNDLYVRDYGKCVLCYKCVEACGEDAQNTFAIAVAGRGFDATIATEFDVALPDSACVYCGNCIGVCPTGALMPKSEYDMRQAGTWDESRQDQVTTVCTFCGVGCNLELTTQDNRIVRVDSPIDHSVTHGHLCIKGRFGYSHVQPD